jgi:hypothetical protein
MAAFDPRLVRTMREALDEAMTRVPPEYATVETKACLAEYILRAAAQGRTTYKELVAAASHATTRRNAEISRGPRF